MKYQVTAGGRTFEIEIDHDSLVRVDGRPLYVDLEQVGGLPVYSLAVDGAGYVLFVDEGQNEYQVEVHGEIFPVEVKLHRPRLSAPETEYPTCHGECEIVSAPLAGRLVMLPAAAGEQVKAGQVVAVVESMKTQMELRAIRDGVIEMVHGPPDRDVSQGEELVRLRSL
jgi:biotin carboxyl carrier protein